MELIFLHGGAAAGKLTTARALADLVGYPVFHNHLTVDLLTTVFTFGSEPFVRLRERIWLDVFAGAAAQDRSIIFTFAPEATVQRGFCDRVRAAVADHGGAVRFVRLHVGEAEQERRLQLPSRREFHKLTDVALLRAGRREPVEVEQPPVDLEIDTEVSTPAESAAAVVAYFSLSAQPSAPRY